MQKHLVALSIAVVISIAAIRACLGAPAGEWNEDLRRCLVSKDIQGGRVVLANDEGIIEIDVQRGTDSDSETYTISFDGQPPIDTTPPKNTTGVYQHRLGPLGTVAPVFSKARRMVISIATADKRAETITIEIGNGAKAMAFLKKCNDYWERQNRKRR
jgi:hypothetical protein